MLLTKDQFMDFMDFPREWRKYDLYSDQLFAVQYAEVLKDLGEDGLKEKLRHGKYGYGSEHYRCGAAFYMVRRKRRVPGLKKALRKDPDKLMSDFVIRDLKL